MSNPSLDQIHACKAPSVTELVAETRIDSPHDFADKPPLKESAAVATGQEGGIDLESWDCDVSPAPPPDPEAISRQFEAQGAQLAEHLRRRQQELDHRES